jgi:hypothetical protein
MTIVVVWAYVGEKMAKQEQPIYQSFLLRCWLSAPPTSGNSAVWRFALREVSADYPEHGFSDLEKLREFVAQQLEVLARGNDREGKEMLDIKRGRL